MNLEGVKPQKPSGFPAGETIENEFVRLVNDNHLNVLEIGSRVVAPGSHSRRGVFPLAQSYTGFDYYPDSNTDVVGDAHKLSQYFGEQKFDAVFSKDVFEHLAMPWVVALEINKVLKINGITFHNTVFAWPHHERPWDFWRFSDEGLKILFSPSLGFEVMKVGLYEPVQSHFHEFYPNQELFSVQPTFARVAILAKKVSEIDRDKFRWDIELEELFSENRQYPKNTGKESVS